MAIRVTIVYDNRALLENLQSGWGFACVVDGDDMPRILFDTGDDGPALIENMARLGFSPDSIDIVFISHDHWDHTGGLGDFLQENPQAQVFVPASMRRRVRAARVAGVRKPISICNNAGSTGELAGIEQSLVLNTGKGHAVVTGCSHPGVDSIMKAASGFGDVHALIGGFHGFSDMGLLRDLDLICACHCTQHMSQIESLYPERTVPCGAGAVIEL